ncbi:WXG100 family type VII secretion target [Paenibacillus aquistagni]|uniref:WXG100 family type VII secretion target n=1 Tax=Paenibacillus aquistagni TaxID=1852522 RepID=UPI00145AC110|nr:WXG100 family type VII secretion target [Paenibacillus aquistagni]NMM55435.1 WXG100 family type VII secretion target [Paenibacillus aquistagni]
MANKLVFNPEQARSVAKSIKNKASNADTLINQLKTEIHSVSGWWEGQSQTAFVQQFDDLLPNFKKLVECVNTISANLDEIARVKQEADQQLASKLRSR